MLKKKGKIGYIVSSLGPCFRNISHDYRANLWVTFIRPLFLPLATMSKILTNSDKELILTKLRGSLKKFFNLPRNFRTDILTEIFPLDFLEWVAIEQGNNDLKWEARRDFSEMPVEGILKSRVFFQRFLPIEFGKLLRKFTAMCKPFYPEHLEEHGLMVYG